MSTKPKRKAAYKYFVLQTDTGELIKSLHKVANKPDCLDRFLKGMGSPHGYSLREITRLEHDTTDWKFCKTISCICGECGQTYAKEIFDLDLKVGDKVTYESWKRTSWMSDYVITVKDTTYKAEGLYFGDCFNGKDEHAIDHYRIDTRKHKFVRL